MKYLILLLLSSVCFAQVVNPPSGGGGGGATIPSTTNLISGDGAGNGADSGIAPVNVDTLSGTQTITGAKTFSQNLNFTSNLGIVGALGQSLTLGSNPIFSFSGPSVADTTGNRILVGYQTGTISPGSGSANFVNFLLSPSISATTSGTVYEMVIAPRGSGVVGGQHKLQGWGTATGTNLAGYSELAYMGIGGDLHASQLAGFGSTPTIAAGAGAGTSPTVSVTGTSSAFTVNVTTGTTPTISSIIATITFPAYGSAPHIVCGAKNAATGLVMNQVFATTTTTTAVLNAGAAGLLASTAYSWDCLVIQ